MYAFLGGPFSDDFVVMSFEGVLDSKNNDFVSERLTKSQFHLNGNVHRFNYQLGCQFGP